jgi:hypothetical protein
MLAEGPNEGVMMVVGAAELPGRGEAMIGLRPGPMFGDDDIVASDFSSAWKLNSLTTSS